MKLRALVLCALGIFGGSTVVAAAPISRVTAMLAGEVLPPGLGIAAVALPPAMVDRDVDPADVTVTWAQSPHVGRGTARIAIRDGRRTRRGWVTLTVAPMREVAIAAHGIPAGTTLGAADVRVERRAVAEGSSLDAVVGSLTQAPLEEGELIAAFRIDDGHHMLERFNESDFKTSVSECFHHFDSDVSTTDNDR